MLRKRNRSIFLVISAVVISLALFSIRALSVPSLSAQIVPSIPSCSQNEVLLQFSPCSSTSTYRNYDLRNIGSYGGVTKAYFLGRKITQADGWFLFGKRNTDCSNWNYLFQSVTLHPLSQGFQYLDATNQVSRYSNSYMKIVSYKNTEFGQDSKLYLCVNGGLCPPGWQICQARCNYEYYCPTGMPTPTMPPGYWYAPGCCPPDIPCAFCEP